VRSYFCPISENFRNFANALKSNLLNYKPRDLVTAVMLLDLYSRRAQLESRPGHRLSFGFPGFPQILRVNNGILPYTNHNRIPPHPFQSTVINYGYVSIIRNHPIIRRCIGSLLSDVLPGFLHLTS
jgi:hypothetical protein